MSYPPQGIAAGPGTGGAVESVNGKTGVVVLTYSDVGAAAADHEHAVIDGGSA